MESDGIWRVIDDANDSKRSCSSEARPSKSIYESDSRSGVRLRTIEDEFENYDVFISHRGPDTKTGFVGYLYEALKRIGLRPFWDCVSISKGQDAWKCIDHAIKTTPIALVIFSHGFIQSEWCLKELHALLASPSMKVLPIFYNVKPSEVRLPKKGQLAVGFAKLLERHDTNVIEEWRTDLKRATNVHGWMYKASDKRLEKDLVLEMVDNVFELSNKLLSLDVGDHIVGVKLAIGRQESKSEGFESLALLNKNELGTSLATVSSSLPSAKVQDDFEASASVVSIEDDDSKSEDFMEFCNITKWIIYRDLQERTLLCFFNVEEKQYEFYFEDHESMATIIGLGVPHSKVVLECESHRVIVVEIFEEDWDVVWANSNFIPLSTPKSYDLMQENFPDILHHIINIINIDKIVSKTNDGGVGGDNGKGKAEGNTDDGKGKSHDHDERQNIGHPDEGSSGAPNNNDKKEWKGRDENDDKKDSHDQNDVNTSSDGEDVKVEVFLRLLPGGILEEKGKKEELREVHEGEKMDLREVHEEEGKKIELGEVHEEEREEEKMELEEIREEEEEEKKEEEGFEAMDKKKRKKKYWKSFLDALKRCKTYDVENQLGQEMIEEIENGDANENLRKQVENQIHIKMVFTFTIKDEVGERSKTIQASILPITFQLPSYNENNYLQSGRFGWFHDYLKVAFGVVDSKVAYLDEESCKVIEPSEAKKVNLRGNAKGNARSSINAFKGKVGIKHGVFASGEYDRTNGSEAKTSEEVQNTWETNQRLIEGGFSISEVTDNSRQLKYVCRPLVPFDEEEFEVKDERGRLVEYNQNPICQLQRVRCQGTWQPYDSESLEEYKLEVSRELEMTRVFKLDLETREEKNKKEIWKVEKNLPLCYIQKLEKIVYLNHGMSHLTSSGKYCLQEKQDQSDPSTSLTQGQYNKAPIWPSSIPLVDVNQ